LDQVLHAGAHFALNIMLARWLPPEEYGAFAVAYSIYLLVSVVHAAVLLQPMVVFGSGRYFDVRRNYLGILLCGHLALTSAAALPVIGISMLFGHVYSPAVARALVTIGLSLPLVLLTWITRRAFYIELRPDRAIPGAVAYCVVLLGAAWWLADSDRLSPVTAIMAMALAGAVAGAAQLVTLRPRWPRAGQDPPLRQVGLNHWKYGRWALASAIAAWFPLNVYYLAMPVWSGLQGAGAFKALTNLANPVLHTLIAFGMLLTPLLVRRRERGGIAEMRRTMRRFLGLFLLGSGAYLVLLSVFRVEILSILYGGKYLEYSVIPLLLVGLLPFGASVTSTLHGGLAALERPDQVFRCYVASSVVALVAGLPLVRLAGPAGALLGLLLSYVTAGSAMLWFFRNNSRDPIATRAA
jgi:O-antigen/teichoic acid export membrane protein